MTTPDNSQNKPTSRHDTSDPNKQDRDKQWVSSLTKALDNANENLDLSTSYALQRARKAALAQDAKPKQLMPTWILGAAAASAFSLVVVLNLDQQPTPTVEPSIEASFQSADFELLTQNDFLLTDEDLEFYAWLESESEFAG